MIDWKSLTTVERAQAVRDRIAAGDGSASIIAASLGTTRNSIIGLCRRNNIVLPGDASMGGRKSGKANAEKLRSAKPAKPKPPKPPLSGVVKTMPKAERAPEPEPIVGGKPFIELREGDCKWPLWDRLPQFASQAPHCGEPTAHGETWCSHHSAKARIG